ncbi:sugar dehydrogenase complex small subunit [Microbulbifer mangrovi]|uniref:sugar dehydrogenase complex small subunit n=1 Tax=Microbulbifer mangrovi TaxID=927787 RepID=UPI001300F151|nr:sugar dehydrogenase complex small subunit [Microbulbifer mangrovi]
MSSGVSSVSGSGPVFRKSPYPPSLDRRQFVRTQFLLAGGMLACPAALLNAQPGEVKEAETRLSKFFAVSQKLLRPLPVDTLLDRRVAARLLAALNREYPSFPQQLDLFPGDPGEGEQRSPLARLIIAAWFLGIVGKELVTYERAMMYRLTSDAFPVRSYCVGEPGSWAKAPDLKFGRV